MNHFWVDVQKRLVPAHRLVSFDPSVYVYVCICCICVHVCDVYKFAFFSVSQAAIAHIYACTQRKPQRLQRKFLVLKAKSSTGLLGRNVQRHVDEPIEQINGGEIDQSVAGSYRIHGLSTPTLQIACTWSFARSSLFAFPLFLSSYPLVT